MIMFVLFFFFQRKQKKHRDQSYGKALNIMKWNTRRRKKLMYDSTLNMVTTMLVLYYILKS